MRPIIVISQKNISDIQQCDLRGIYIPLLKIPEECVKDPILIAYYNFHFMPLIFPIDEETNNGIKEFEFTENFFHFKNVDLIETKSLSNNEQYDGICRSYDKNKRDKFMNALPLVDFDLEHMKTHFLKENEEKNPITHLKHYLKYVYVNLLQRTVAHLH